MGFTAKIDEKLLRFKEFDEARVFLEHPAKIEDIQNAIDYMIAHNEFHYLLRMLLEKKHLQDGQIASYLFARLPCLKREEDRALLQQLRKQEALEELTVSYLFGCCEEFDLGSFFEGTLLNEVILSLALEHGECASVQELMRQIQKRHKEEEILLRKFFEVYGV